MTDPNYTAIALLIDSSGSMSAIRDEAEQAINTYIKDQAAEAGKRTIRITTFSSGPNYLHRNHGSVPAAGVEPFTLRPNGGTALLDAMYTELVDFGQELAALPEDQRPGQVIFAVMTDGEENSSQEHGGPEGWARVKAAVQEQVERYGWHVLYLGANQDAIQVGSRLGVGAHATMDWAASAAGTRGTGEALRSYTAVASAGGPAHFTDKDRKAARGG